MTDFETLGGREGVERLVRAFVEASARDFIVGFFFEGKDLERIILHETELAVAHLGGPSRYSGKPLRAAHGPLRINRGHFRRRLAILRTILREEGAPEDIVDRWVEANRALESSVVIDRDCVD